MYFLISGELLSYIEFSLFLSYNFQNLQGETNPAVHHIFVPYEAFLAAFL